MAYQEDRITSIPAPLPKDYDRGYSFTDYQTINPGKPAQGAALDNEFANIEQALDETQARARLIQRDDGALKNDSVGEDQLVVDVALQSALDTEISARQSADSSLQTSISQEVQDRQDADNTLSQSISSNSSAISSLQTSKADQSSLNAEIQNRQDADNLLQGDINSRLPKSDVVDLLTSSSQGRALSANQGRILDGKISSNLSAIQQEATNRQSADANLQEQVNLRATISALSTETQNRENKDADLQDQLDVFNDANVSQNIQFPLDLGLITQQIGQGNNFDLGGLA